MLSAKTTLHYTTDRKTDEQKYDNAAQQRPRVPEQHPEEQQDIGSRRPPEQQDPDYLNENYVCDITMIKLNELADDRDYCDINDDLDGDLYNQNEKDLDEVSLCSSSSSSYGSDNGRSSPMFFNEIEIDRGEEETTITELVRASSEGELIEGTKNNRMRLAFGIILRLVLPLANGVARSIKGIRDVRFLRALKNIVSSRQALTNMLAFAANTISMSLASVQVSHRIEPILKLLKIRKARDGLESLPDSATPSTSTATTPTTPTIYSPFLREPRGSLPLRYTPGERRTPVHQQPAPNCCTLNILAEPPPGTPIRADIVFIHGLHGSLVNTWKQGLWENERRPVEFERPPKPPLRPPKRPRHSRTGSMQPPHKEKRARFMTKQQLMRRQYDSRATDEEQEYAASTEEDMEDNEFSYICGEQQETQLCDGMEYSFPTFRVRMNHHGRQLQAELESLLNGQATESIDEAVAADSSSKQRSKNNNSNKKKSSAPKPSSDDPNYSRCWPGDWLPLDCPGVRVIAVNYTTDQYLWRPLWKQKEPRTNLVQRSREMAELLIAQRVGYGHPIIWVGHSKGGLFVKQIIVDAWESGRPAAAPFWRSARGAFFYSVPHRGSHLASIKAPLLTRSVELLDIEKNSKYLIDLHRRFACLYQLGHLKIEVFSFVETALTLMSVLYLRIVGADSADPGIGDVCGIHLDHREICKPRSRECILYKELVKMIKKVC